MDDFDTAPVLESNMLSIRPLRAEDREGLFAVSTREVWAGHPATERYRRDVFDPYFDGLVAGGGAMAVREARTGRIIGTSRFYAEPVEPGGISIGYTFLATDHWGGTTNFEMKRLMFGHVFASRDAVWLHIAPTNIRSQIASGRVGARMVREGPLDLGTGLVPYQTWCVTRAAWDQVARARGA